MASQFIEAVGFGVLNDVLAIFRTNEGYAQPNRYEVLIYPPIGQQLGNVHGGGLQNKRMLEQLTLRCESVNLPGRNIATSDDTNIYGPVRQVAEGVTYAEDISLSFQASSDLKEREYFEEWQRRIFNEQNWNMQYYNTYVGFLEIYLLDKLNKRRYGLKCHDVFPKTIGPTALSYAGGGDIIKLPVDFSFRYWTTLNITRQAPNILGNIAETIIETVERKITSNIPKVISKLL